ncbi:UNVERIFIED_ORG: hypothetical protein M2438_003635 [Methylobacterium sp. SuP10 SLI 274]|uniref:hypothetical protein n=1 Tax=Methylorubrum extorquens TaxID=408 RepID=UPI0020A0D0D5|nr:hypothetical protein [Methylorubrum extorquens]MDF9864885.1 hypothetical protein [Methylorubrum pseudosasae]MDH6638460.1 hypothetical protein [Methylobacterium sp. SuP10 SLI 274]MDH6667643.1 hypothetical protein [Methylorubrum zatmanii]MCP1559541.1 hypothetical protein [Methylorubrum extorquens]MDF9793183.1 hypothetical protein [Methylorubrum extorquens]
MVPPLADGHRFNGRWNHGFGSTGAMGGGTVAARHSRRPERSGRYAVSAYRRTLTEDAGTRETLSLFASDRNSNKLLVIGVVNALRQGR